MRFPILLVAVSLLTVSSAWGQDEATIVELEYRDGFGPFFPPLGGAGPAGDPIGGPMDLTGDFLSGVPDSLREVDVRFLNFHYDQGEFQSQNPGKESSAHVVPGLTTQYVDQQVHYLVGRDVFDDFVWIVDTDNDEDLSDEAVQILPWDGPRMSLDVFQDSVVNGPDLTGFVRTMPSVRVTGQVFDGRRVMNVTKRAFLIPFLEISYPGPGGSISKPFYWLALDGHYEGTFDVGGRTYRIWVRSASNSGLVEPRWTHIRVKDVTDVESDWTDEDQQASPTPYILGDVVQLGARYYRLDDVDPLGKSISLVEVSNPTAGLLIGSPVPEFHAVTLDGEELSPASMGGRYFLLSFWSTRNTSGRGQLDKTYSSYRRSCVEFVTVLDDDAKSAQKLDWLGIPWPIVADRDQAESLQDLFSVSRHPTFVLVDPNGQVREWQSVGTDPFRNSRTPPEIVDTMKDQLGESCVAAPERDDVMAVLDANPTWTRDSPWYLDGCSFTADSIAVIAIGAQPEEQGWPVKLAMEGLCTPTPTSESARPWREGFTLNTYLYRSLGEWALIAGDPFIELEP